jgi:hypothetical protein
MDVHSHTKFQVKFRVLSLACVEGEQRYGENDAKPLEFDGLCWSENHIFHRPRGLREAKRLLLGKYLHELRKLQVGTFSKPEDAALAGQISPVKEIESKGSKCTPFNWHSFWFCLG